MRSINMKNPKILLSILVLTNPLSWVLLVFAAHAVAIYLAWTFVRETLRFHLAVSVRKPKKVVVPTLLPAEPIAEEPKPVFDRPMPTEVHTALVDLAHHAKRTSRSKAAMPARSYAQETKPKRPRAAKKKSAKRKPTKKVAC
jgi:hypothetical protein